MSLVINVDKVKRVLLADGWHKVDFNDKEKSTFDLSAYEFIAEREYNSPVMLHRVGESGVCPTGASWLENGEQFFCPLTGILAVSYGDGSHHGFVG